MQCRRGPSYPLGIDTGSEATDYNNKVNYKQLTRAEFLLFDIHVDGCYHSIKRFMKLRHISN